MTLRRSAIVLTATSVLGTGLGVALEHAHDVRLDEAMDALQKAAALVEAARTDTETTTDQSLRRPSTNSTGIVRKPWPASRTRWITSLPQRQRQRQRWIPTVPDEEQS